MSLPRSSDDRPLDAPPLSGNTGILIVDEDPAFQLGLKTFLREYVGFEKVFIASNGQEALDCIGAEPSIGVITLDFRMPGMSGIEMVRTLAEAPPRPLSIIMITGYPSDELESEFHSLGSNVLLTTHFLAKPVQFEKLEHIVIAAHDEVIEAKRKALLGNHYDDETDPDSDPPLAILSDKLAQQSARLADLEHELKSQRGKWRSDFWKVVFLLLVFWVAGQFGLLKKIEPRWERLKDTIRASFAYTAKEKAPVEAPGKPTEASPAPEGRPL